MATASILALLALAVALLIGLGRQVTVFTAFRPGLWLFRRYPRKRRLGIAFVVVLSTAAVLVHPTPTVVGLVVASVLLSVWAVVFDLERLFPALDRVRSLPVDRAADGEGPGVGGHVLVVEVGEERRAYPLETMVMPRHLVHDVVAGVPVAVTYCALCRSGLVFRREHGGRRFVFRVVGVFRRNLIMEDLQTHSLWQQATGEAIAGPLAGEALSLVPATQMRWDRARTLGSREGMTRAVEPEDAPPALLASNRGFRLLELATERVMTPGKTRLSRALPPRATVFGIRLDGAAKAYPLSVVRSAGPFRDRVRGVELELEFDEAGDALRARRPDGESDPVVERHWWLGWNEFYPDTEVYRSPPPRSGR